MVVQNAKMQEVKSLARCLGDLAVRWWRGFACFAYFAPALRAWFGGSVEMLESRCVWACRGFVVLGRWWDLRKFCKNYAKIANFCATICADRFRSCYLKLCQIVPKSSRAV